MQIRSIVIIGTPLRLDTHGLPHVPVAASGIWSRLGIVRSSEVAHLLLALRMEVDALDGSRNLVEAYVIETFKTCAADRPNSMVWHQKIFLPAHEQMLFLHPILCDQLWSR